MTYSELLDLDKTAAKSAAKRESKPSHKPRPTPRHHDTSKGPTTPNHRDSMPPRHHDTTVSRHQATVTPALVRRLRRGVVHLGKEVSTHRFTKQEKDDLAQIIYEQGRKGWRTCENEIVRIALHWLLDDHSAQGNRGVLVRTLRALRR